VVDDLPTLVRWIIVAAVGLSPILTFWLVAILGRFLRAKCSRSRTETPRQFADWATFTRIDPARQLRR
jgi:hypothetical protein